jgi:hypothetical protein
MKKLILYCLLCLISINTFAQKSRKEKKDARNEKINALIKQEEEGVLIYKKHLIYGAYLNTDGYGILLEKGLRQEKRKTTLLRLELSEKKHNKEERTLNQSAFGQINSGIDYKLNNFYQFKIGYGIQYLVGSKGNKNGIEVTAVGVGGLSLGLLKPYLFDVLSTSGKSYRADWNMVEDSAAAGKIAANGLGGHAGFSTGWNKLKIKPGLYLKTGLRFDYGRFNEKVNAVEAGLFFEYFSGKIPQMYSLKQKSFFPGAYITILMGKRK